jgi:hypothetical protein
MAVISVVWTLNRDPHQSNGFYSAVEKDGIRRVGLHQITPWLGIEFQKPRADSHGSGAAAGNSLIR